jgi:hypothetical protein
MLHPVLHDVLEAFGLYLQQPFLKQVRQGGMARAQSESGTKGQKQASRFIGQELESSMT